MRTLSPVFDAKKINRAKRAIVLIHELHLNALDEYAQGEFYKIVRSEPPDTPLGRNAVITPVLSNGFVSEAEVSRSMWQARCHAPVSRAPPAPMGSALIHRIIHQ